MHRVLWWRYELFCQPHCILTLKLLHPHCQLCWTNVLHSKTSRAHPRLKIHSSLLTLDLKRPMLETIYRRSRRPSDFQSFKKQSIIVHKLISDSQLILPLTHSGTQRLSTKSLVYLEFPSFSQYTIMFAFFFMCFYYCCLISEIFWWQNITSVFKTSTTCNSSNWPGSNHTTSAFVFCSINGGRGQKSCHVFLRLFLWSGHYYNQSPQILFRCTHQTYHHYRQPVIVWGIFPNYLQACSCQTFAQKTQLTPRWTLQLSPNLKSEFRFEGSGTYHSCSYIITFGIVPINYSLPDCIMAVSFHWNCPSSYPKWSSCNQLTKSFSLGTFRSVYRFWYDWS